MTSDSVPVRKTKRSKTGDGDSHQSRVSTGAAMSAHAHHSNILGINVGITFTPPVQQVTMQQGLSIVDLDAESSKDKQRVIHDMKDKHKVVPLTSIKVDEVAQAPPIAGRPWSVHLMTELPVRVPTVDGLFSTFRASHYVEVPTDCATPAPVAEDIHKGKQRKDEFVSYPSSEIVQPVSLSTHPCSVPLGSTLQVQVPTVDGVLSTFQSSALTQGHFSSTSSSAVPADFEPC